jgi:thiosulfate/3-mercaptopyruvate sulfurtransferase
MAFTTLIGPAEAADHLDDPDWVFVDCRFVLGQPDAGAAEYAERHLPGAIYADLDRDLSGPIVPLRTGRHPLPSPDALVDTASRLGIDGSTQVVAYDAASGAMAAARLWWLLKWAGHEAVAVLDGGLAGWDAAGLPTSSGVEKRADRRFEARFRPELVAGTAEVIAAAEHTASDAVVVIDARAADRYRGENETVDPVAGHIPGALSLPYAGNVDPAGTFLGVDALRARFEGVGLRNPVFYCGSGVTAAQSVLAYQHAGLGMARLYPGSWSEWITDPDRPVATGR